MKLRRDLQGFVDTLLARPGPSHSLDEVAEVIGAALITSEEIGLVLDALEAAGRKVGVTHAASARQTLGKVLTTARSLTQELGRKPAQEEIARRANLSMDDVRMALLYAQVLQR
jgi:hypothetical protein